MKKNEDQGAEKALQQTLAIYSFTSEQVKILCENKG